MTGTGTIVDGLIVASLLISLIVVILQIGLMNKVKDLEIACEILMLDAIVNAEVRTRKTQQNMGVEDDDNDKP